MRTVLISKQDVMSSACNSGRYFVKKVFSNYGKGIGYADSVLGNEDYIELSLALLITILKDFTEYHSTTKIHEIRMCGIHTHLRCFLDCVLEAVSKKSSKSSKGEFSNAWEGSRASDKPINIIRGFWRELKRVTR